MPSSGVQTCALDRKSTRLNSSHGSISYAVFCLKKNNYCGKKCSHVQKRIGVFKQTPENLEARRSCRNCDIALLQTYFFFFNDTATTEIYTLSLHDALPIFEIAELVFKAIVERDKDLFSKT